MTTAITHDVHLGKLRELIKDIDFCMLTTIAEDGSSHSRPMSTNGQIEPNGDIWFFTYADSAKVAEVDRVEQVKVIAHLGIEPMPLHTFTNSLLSLEF